MPLKSHIPKKKKKITGKYSQRPTKVLNELYEIQVYIVIIPKRKGHIYTDIGINIIMHLDY